MKHAWRTLLSPLPHWREQGRFLMLNEKRAGAMTAAALRRKLAGQECTRPAVEIYEIGY